MQGIWRPLVVGGQEVGAQRHQDQDLGAPRAQIQHLDRWLYFGIFEHIQKGRNLTRFPLKLCNDRLLENVFSVK